MHEKDRALIQSIQNFFGGIGYVTKPNKNSMVEFRVSTLNQIIAVIIPHFDKYPLITKKNSDYLLFKQIILKLLNNKNINYNDIQEIVNIKASLNLGLSKELKLAFPNSVPVIKPEILLKNIKEPLWVAGFATGESNFFIALQNSKTKNGISVYLRFSISQHSRDLLLLESLVKSFGYGYVAKYDKRSICEFIVTRIDHIVEHVIPFFEEYPVVGSKYSNFLVFKQAALIIKNKEHLNPDRKGLEKLLELKKQGSFGGLNYNNTGEK